MTDVFSQKKRSNIMSRVSGKNTRPEVIVRKILFSLGHRYRLHVSKLPGKPDIVLGKQKIAIFVNGCFWHKHNCGKNVVPATNVRFWAKKLDDNVRRQRKHLIELKWLGWKPVIIWECQTRKRDRLIGRLSKLI